MASEESHPELRKRRVSGTGLRPDMRPSRHQVSGSPADQHEPARSEDEPHGTVSTTPHPCDHRGVLAPRPTPSGASQPSSSQQRKHGWDTLDAQHRDFFSHSNDGSVLPRQHFVEHRRARTGPYLERDQRRARCLLLVATASGLLPPRKQTDPISYDEARRPSSPSGCRGRSWMEDTRFSGFRGKKAPNRTRTSKNLPSHRLGIRRRTRILINMAQPALRCGEQCCSLALPKLSRANLVPRLRLSQQAPAAPNGIPTQPTSVYDQPK